MADNSLITQSQLQSDLENFYNTKVYPYLNGSANLGFTPIGTVISVMSNEAPDNYLVCDGTTYNISDYSDLANFFEEQFGSKNYFGGNGTTTFAVPDLRGEFLRGTGTNSHENQGDGGNVGVHQDSTEINAPILGNNLITPAIAGTAASIINFDKAIKTNTSKFTSTETLQPSSDSYKTYRTIRPTNTSVLYCIAYKNIYISTGIGGYPVEVTNPTDGQIVTFDATNQKWVNGGHKYSTNEHVVGTWIDGKPLYEKTFLKNTGITTGLNTLTHNISNLDKIIKIEGMGKREDGYFMPIPTGNIKAEDIPWSVMLNGGNSTVIQFSIGGNYVSPYAFTEIYIIIHYTKTTDTV